MERDIVMASGGCGSYGVSVRVSGYHFTANLVKIGRSDRDDLVKDGPNSVFLS